MTELLVVAVALFGFAMVSQRLAMSPITAPMVFTAIGIAVGPAGFDLFDLGIDAESTSLLVEATLVLVLFTDAIRIDLRVLRREARLPGLLLGIGMPLTIAAGTGAAVLLFPSLDLVEAMLLAAVLTPTDAALGQAVVSNRRLPVRVRQTLNVESGLNDGIAVPVVTVLLAAASVSERAGSTADWIELAARQVGFGLLAGVGIGAIGAWLLDRRAGADEIEGVYQQLATISIAVAAFAVAGVLDGNGFIAAFTAGLTFGVFARSACEGVQDFTEDEGELLSAITFIVFGAVLAGPLLDELTWRHAVYAAASLTVVRMVPVLVSLLGSGLMRETRLFLGWFGPRGLASILFALLIEEELDGPVADTIVTAAVWTALISVLAHGLTAAWWSGHLADTLRSDTTPMPETEPATDLAPRRRL